MNKREKDSSRLRNTERIAELCDFEYNKYKNKYGGFFTVFQVEKVVRTLEEKNNEIERLKAEIEVLKAKSNSDDG